MRRVRCSPSSTSSTAAATWPGPGGSVQPSADPSWASSGPSRSSTLARPGTVPSWPSSSSAVTSSPVSTVSPSANSSVKPDRSRPRSRSRKVSATATRSRCATTSASRPSSPISNSTLPSSVGSTLGRSQTRATAMPSPVRALRRSADAATPSAAAMAKRALTPERWSTDDEPRRPRVSRAMTSSRCSGTSATSVASCAMSATSSSTSLGVVGADLGAEPVLQRGDDAAAVGVVLGVRGGDEQHVHGQPQAVAADLDVALLQHVEHRDLDPLGEVGQLVDAEDPAVGARQQAVVHGLRVTERAPLGDLHRVDVADQVADAGVGGGQLLDVALVAVPPGDRQVVADLGSQSATARADRGERVVVDLAALDVRRPLVEQGAERAHQPGLALAALTEEHQVVAGEQRALELRAARCRRTRRCPGRRSPRRAAGTRRLSRISALTERAW